MVQSSWPFDTQTVSEDQWSRMFRLAAPTGVGSGLVVSAGAGLEVQVTAGDATVRGHHYSSTGTESLTIGENLTGNPRIDRVILRLDAGAVLLAVKTGSAASTPQPPALEQTDTGIWEMTLAQVRVEASAGSVAVTDERTWPVLDGDLHRLGVSVPLVQSGRVSISAGTIDPKDYKEVTAVFDHVFQSTPRVVVSNSSAGGGSQRLVPRASTTTTSSVRILVYNVGEDSTTFTGSHYVNYVAVGE